MHTQEKAVFRSLRNGFERMYGNAPCFLHRIRPFARKLIQPLAIHAHGGIHRCDLFDLAHKGREHSGKLLHADISFAARSHRAIGILRIGRTAKCDLSIVFLFLVHKVIKQARRPPEADGQHTGRARIERARVPHAFHVENMPDIRHRVG